MLRIKNNPAFPPNSIGPLRKARGLTMEQLGEAIGTDASTVNKLEKSLMRVTDKWLPKLVEALDATADELLKDPDAPAQPSGEVRPATISVPASNSMARDLPVRGTAAGSHMAGSFQFDGAVVDYVRRPASLIGAMSAYGLYIEGQSMVPEHNPGDLRIVHPDRPPRFGDSVIVQVQNGPNEPVESVIGHLIRRTEKSIFIGKLNPPATVEIKRAYVKSVHKVLTINEIFGV